MGRGSAATDAADRDLPGAGRHRGGGRRRSGATGRALLALVVAVALVIGVNYANDYSDGIRGTDDERVGPVRLVGSRLAVPAAVRTRRSLCFSIAALAGLTLVSLTRQWWLVAVGAACIAGAWFYTGGRRPYGYAGLGEVAVFVFFGPVAVLGTALTQSGTVSPLAIVGAAGVGLLACAVLVVNNLRDIAGDTAAGKRTLAVALGDIDTRRLYVGVRPAAAGALGARRDPQLADAARSARAAAGRRRRRAACSAARTDAG